VPWAWRFRPVVIEDGNLARSRLELVHRIKPYADADWDERPERAMYPRAQGDPFFLGFSAGTGWREEDES
jgi:hypothetical protein